MIRLNDALKDTLVVFLTSRSSMREVVSAISFGVDSYLVKPLVKEELIKKLAQLESKYLSLKK